MINSDKLIELQDAADELHQQLVELQSSLKDTGETRVLALGKHLKYAISGALEAASELEYAIRLADLLADGNV